MSACPVSVIVPVHNAHAHLGAALDSISAQTIAAQEVIVVDDGSQPPIRPLAEQHLPGVIVLEQANAGPSAARNCGLRRATGMFVSFLDADDRWTSDALAILAQGFRDAPGADAVQGLVRRFRDPAESDVEGYDGHPYLGFNVGALMARRQTLVEAGPFDEELKHSEDVDLFMRLQDRGARRLAIPQLVLEYRRHTGSLSAHADARQSARNWIGLLHKRRGRGRSRPAGEAMPALRVSVVLAVRNGRRYLPFALTSIRQQTLVPCEILAVVGKSDDGTLEYLRGEPDVHVIEQHGIGLATARNQGLAQARGEWIAFYDHDDLWDARKLEMQARSVALFEKPAASLTHFHLVRDMESGDPAQVSNPVDPLPRIGWTPSALFAHRDIFGAIGPFDSDLGMGCDTDWFRRLKASCLPCALTGQALLRKRIHGENLSREPLRNRAAMFQVLKKHRLERRK